MKRSMRGAEDPATVEIEVEEYERLKRDSEKLAVLERGGVDNWEGYSIAMESIPDEDNEAAAAEMLAEQDEGWHK